MGAPSVTATPKKQLGPETGGDDGGPLQVKTARAWGASLIGTEAELVTVEGRFAEQKKGRSEVLITGLPDPIIRESRGRLISALEENRLRVRTGRLYLNLVPAARKKSGEALDLPLALSAASALGYLDPRLLKDTLFLGELGIDGRLYGVPGGTAAALVARRSGITSIVAPLATAREAACVPEMKVYAGEHLNTVLGHLAAPGSGLARVRAPERAPEFVRTGASLDEVRGQATGKLALAIAAAGGHALLLVGPPGTGKSMLARGLRRMLPEPTLEERIAITSILSAIGRWPGGLAGERPFRAPHHSASDAGIVGGGVPLGPGEVTLAHCGVLFLDELPEFRRTTLEALRQPMETGDVHLCRATRRMCAPARFHLVAAMNPCPCGYMGHDHVPCRCSEAQVERYRSRISGPLIDRIDLRVEIHSPGLMALTRTSSDASEATGPAPSAVGTTDTDPTSEARLLEGVERAARRRLARGQTEPNATLDGRALDRWAPVTGRSRTLLGQAERRQGLSARGLQSLRRVARTIADFEDRDKVDTEHLMRALALRAPIQRL